MSDFSRLMEWAYAHGGVLPPEPIEAPTIGPTNIAVGAVLTATNGTWTHNPASYAYAWNRAGTAIGTNASTYTTVAGDLGWGLRCAVTATNASGSALSSPSNAVVPHA